MLNEEFVALNEQKMDNQYKLKSQERLLLPASVKITI
jgi:hypothetical protein